MPRSGGVYALPSPPNPLVPNTLAKAEDLNTTLTDIATALTGSVPTDGSASLAGDLNANGHNISGVNGLTATGLTATNVTSTGTITGNAINTTGSIAAAGNITSSANMSVTGNLTANGEAFLNGLAINSYDSWGWSFSRNATTGGHYENHTSDGQHADLWVGGVRQWIGYNITLMRLDGSGNLAVHGTVTPGGVLLSLPDVATSDPRRELQAMLDGGQLDVARALSLLIALAVERVPA
jgi:hypothetical protein